MSERLKVLENWLNRWIEKIMKIKKMYRGE